MTKTLGVMEVYQDLQVMLLSGFRMSGFCVYNHRNQSHCSHS